MEAQGDCTLLSFPSATPFTWGTFFVPEGMFSGVDTGMNLLSVPLPTERERWTQREQRAGQDSGT